MSDQEPRIHIQARICPICVDDHSENRECYLEDLKNRIATLKAEVNRVHHEHSQAATALKNKLEGERLPQYRRVLWDRFKKQTCNHLDNEQMEELIAKVREVYGE